MNDLDMGQIYEFVNSNIATFHAAKLVRVQKINLRDVLKKKNPYLFKAKGITTATGLVSSVLDAFLSSSEEEIFGEFLEGLAIYIAEQSSGGRKSSTTGIDLEFDREQTRYLVAIKSGPNWGNSSQYAALRDNFKTAKRVLQQSKRIQNVQPVLGICYGKTKTVSAGDYLKITGQNFWYFLSGIRDLYVQIIEPIGYEAKRHNELYALEKDKVYNKFTREFLNEFSDNDGAINWDKLVRFNSGNVIIDEWY
jgi:hypothetical protein